LELETTEVAVTKLPCPLETTEVAVTKLPCPLETTEVAIAELLAQYEEMVVAELLVDQKEWEVLGPQVTTSMFDLTVYTASVALSTHLKKFHAGYTI
jgi:hypothetical protein